MTNAVVVDKLSKKFLLRHNVKPKPGEGMLRDTMAQFVKRMFSSNADRQTSGEEEVFWALRDVGFTVREGERLGIVGRNGAGKSTLLKVISRITSPSSGSIRIRGRLSSLLEVGTGFHPELTGRENIFLNGAILGMRQAEVRTKFDAIVDFAEVERFLDTPVKRYSSGMYVKLAFAVSSFLEPDIVVLDEVLSVGDAAFQRKSQHKIRSLAAEGRTVIFVSHSMAAMRDMCDTAIILNAGSSSDKMPVDAAVECYLKQTLGVESVALPIVTDEVDLLSVSLCQDGIPAEAFTASQPVEVRIEFRVKTQLYAFRMGFYIKTGLGDTITRALMADWDPEQAFVVPGEYLLRATIPAHFLVAGEFLLEVHCSRFGIRDYFADLAVFPFRISPSTSYNRQHIQEQPFGMVYLNPDWQLEKA